MSSLIEQKNKIIDELNIKNNKTLTEYDKQIKVIENYEKKLELMNNLIDNQT